MKIIVCYKWVPDEQDIKIEPDLKLDMSRVKWKISEYDKNAIEAATAQAEQNSAEVICLTYGTKAKPSLKDALSRGPAKACWINDPSSETADGFVTGNVLAAAIKKLGIPDMILFGEGSEDAYGQQVGARVAHILGLSALTFATKIKANDENVTVTRNIGSCTEDVTASYPVIISVLPEMNKPRIPSLKQVLQASKKPIEKYQASELGLTQAELTPKNKVKSVLGFVMNRKNIIYKDESSEEKATLLVQELKKEGLA